MKTAVCIVVSFAGILLAVSSLLTIRVKQWYSQIPGEKRAYFETRMIIDREEKSHFLYVR